MNIITYVWANPWCLAVIYGLEVSTRWNYAPWCFLSKSQKEAMGMKYDKKEPEIYGCRSDASFGFRHTGI